MIAKRIALGTATSVVAAMLIPAAAQGAPFVVNELADAHDADFPGGVADGVCDRNEATPELECTLRGAAEEATASTAAGNDLITFSVTGTHPLTLGPIVAATSANATITITGNGQDVGGTTIDANDTGLVMAVGGPDVVTLSDLRLEDGRVSNSSGAGIHLSGSKLVLNRATVTANEVNTSVNGVGGVGINVFGGGALELHQSTVSDNVITGTGAGAGAGIKTSGLLILDRSTVSGNDANTGTGSEAGGIDLLGGFAHTIANSTISGNRSGTSGAGGIFARNSITSLTITNSTIANNSTAGTGGGLLSFAPSLTVKNSIFAANTNGSGTDTNCNTAATFGSAVNNIESPDASCNFAGAPGAAGNQQTVAPAALALGTLAGNGGPTQTHALGGGSVAVNAADNATCAAAPVDNLDQRGVTRPQQTSCDVGAYEFVPPPPATSTPVATPTLVDNTAACDALRSKLKKAKTKKKKRKIRKRLRALGC